MKLSQTRISGVCTLVGVLGTAPTQAAAADYTLAIQPVQSPEATLEAFEPLARYLSTTTGHRFEVVTELNFLTYWEKMRHRNNYDFVLDAAHFTDFRVNRQEYEVLVKLPDTVSYSLVTHEDVLLFEPGELIGQPVATAPSPSLGGVRLSQMFPNPLRQPTIVPTANFQEALRQVREGEVRAALVPTPLISNNPTVNTVTTTEPVPHMALSASPRVDHTDRQLVATLLIDARDNPRGRAMLEAINLPGFEPANAAMYEGYANLLEGVWGY